MVFRKMLLFMVAIIAISMPVSTAATEEQTDYMAKIIACLASGDIKTARTLNHQRDVKINQTCSQFCKVNVDDLNLIAKIIHSEAGSSWLSDEHQGLVGSVLLNRVASPEFPNTVAECVYQPGQYYKKSSTYFSNLRPSERAVRNALYLLDHGSIAPSSVVFQSNYLYLGSGIWKQIRDKHLGSKYFCYSSNPRLYA